MPTPNRKAKAPEEHIDLNEADRTAYVSQRLKQLYKKHILPAEQRYQYEFFYESPLLSDVEFDGKSSASNITW